MIILVQWLTTTRLQAAYIYSSRVVRQRLIREYEHTVTKIRLTERFQTLGSFQ